MDVEEILLERIDECNETLRLYSADTDEHTRAAKNLQIYMDQLRQLRESEKKIEIDDRNQSLEEVKHQIEVDENEKTRRSRKWEKVWDTIGKIGGVIGLGIVEVVLMNYIYEQEDINNNIGDQRKLKKLDFLKRIKI